MPIAPVEAAKDVKEIKASVPIKAEVAPVEKDKVVKAPKELKVLKEPKAPARRPNRNSSKKPKATTVEEQNVEEAKV